MKKKDFSLLDLGNLIAMVESLINEKEPPANKFIFLHKSYRFLNLDFLKKSIINKWDPGVRSVHLRLHPVRVKSAFRMLYQSIFRKVKFSSSADIIIIRANVSLFCFDKGIRVKIFMPGGGRSLPEFKNEFAIRKKVEESELFFIPKLLDGNLRSEPYFFVDEIVLGDVLSWVHPKSRSIFREIIPQMWSFYQFNGIIWSTLQEKGIDIDEIIEDYKSLMNRSSNYRFDFDLNKIKEFGKKLIPCSLIHGDLSIDNIISTSKGNYIIDWELSRHDFIIRDFIKILIIKEWNLHEDIDRLMRSEIKECFCREKNSALSLSEQFLLAFFLDVYSAYKNSLYSRRLRIFEKQFKLFNKSVQ